MFPPGASVRDRGMAAHCVKPRCSSNHQGTGQIVHATPDWPSCCRPRRHVRLCRLHSTLGCAPRTADLVIRHGLLSTRARRQCFNKLQASVARRLATTPARSACWCAPGLAVCSSSRADNVVCGLGHIVLWVVFDIDEFVTAPTRRHGISFASLSSSLRADVPSRGAPRVASLPRTPLVHW